MPVTILCVALACATSTARAQENLPRGETNRITFQNADVRLTGWGAFPKSRTPVPAVLLIGGNNASWKGYDPYFRVMIDSLNARGIAVFYYDHRGDGLSEGSWLFSSFEDLADDAIAAIHTIARDPRVDATRLGVWGHSMGGWIAPLAAARSDAIRFVITAAGTAVTPLEQTAHHHFMQDLNKGIPRHVAVEMDALRRDLWSYYTSPTERRLRKAQETFAWSRRQPWFERAKGWRELQGVGEQLPPLAFVQSARFDTLIAGLRRESVHNPVPSLQKLKVPLLALYGDADPVIPLLQSKVALEAAFQASGNTQLTTKTFAGANHMLLTGRTLDATSFAPGYLDTMARWILNPHGGNTH